MSVEYVWSGNPDVVAAIPLLRLGRLSRCVEESLVIEFDEHSDGSPSVSSKADPAPDEADHTGDAGGDTDADSDTASVAAINEGDLPVEDFDDSEDLPREPWGNSGDKGWFAPGSVAPRQLMQARAQQCVVCLQDKEHTFVPPHREDGGAHDVSGHRFCTDCWAEFLYHSSRQQHRRAGPRPLVCPLCRGGIHVPDVWGATYVLPRAWMQRAARDKVAAVVPVSGASSSDEAEQLHLWAGCTRRNPRPAGRVGREQPEQAEQAEASTAAGAAENRAAA
eukprot:CAMPEP_0176071796 /NCGR_PEP_ID=MMETSP0120_2-20121206/35862_1 /TAXON_ID=160619 /ORGANISM="Kryptoperidinium foliaceum, Strain CCMP 1326" /LENGTH=277 /DNA_ID=CAMNT_0017405457 /DNA_START=119 /DNA_END=952 /DNA_ORIENTATION=+